ncbi:MAG: TlpA family protein disulfide reductase [Deltaproteobacteria bacterium]|nr:TlpA family protein disulfide reductase [Deltaproteobacteria bacterium]MBW2256820.1 TlpA family protein disulfide reductase [Deltaproteobacteria bacterium]
MTWRDLFGASMLAVAVLFAPLAGAGTPAHDFTLRDLSGQTVTLEDYRGQVVLLDFWATWCAPCKDAMPHWQRMYDDLRDSGFVVLAVTTDDARSKPQVKPFIRRSGYDFPVLYDPDSSALVVYNPNKTLPFSVLIDRNFEIAAIHTGYNPGDEEHVRTQVQALLAAEVGTAAEPAAAEPTAAEPAASPAE